MRAFCAALSGVNGGSGGRLMAILLETADDGCTRSLSHGTRGGNARPAL